MSPKPLLDSLRMSPWLPPLHLRGLARALSSGACTGRKRPWKLFEVLPEPSRKLLSRNAPFRISELGYALLQNRFPRAEIMARPSLAQVRYAYEGYNASRYAIVDFPGLLLIETPLTSLASVPAGSALAGRLNQSNIAVSDLSAMVRHGNHYKHTISCLLSRFATQAGDVVGLPQAFANTVSRSLI